MKTHLRTAWRQASSSRCSTAYGPRAAATSGGVVGAQRVVDEPRAPSRRPSSSGERAEDRPALGGVAVPVQLLEVASGARRRARAGAASARRRRRVQACRSSPSSGSSGPRPTLRPTAGKSTCPRRRRSARHAFDRLVEPGESVLARRARRAAARSCSSVTGPPPPPARRRAGSGARAGRPCPRRGCAGAARRRRGPCSRSRARAASTGGKSISPSPKSRCSWTPRRMSSIWTLTSRGPGLAHAVDDRLGSTHWQWPMSRVSPSRCGSPSARGKLFVARPDRSTSMPGSGSKPSTTPRSSA